MSNISEYSIINTKEIVDEIGRLSKEIYNIGAKNLTKGELERFNKAYGNWNAYKTVLNKSIPLEKTLKSSFKSGFEANRPDFDYENGETVEGAFDGFIKNLTIKK